MERDRRDVARNEVHDLADVGLRLPHLLDLAAVHERQREAGVSDRERVADEGLVRLREHALRGVVGVERRDRVARRRALKETTPPAHVVASFIRTPSSRMLLRTRTRL